MIKTTSLLGAHISIKGGIHKAIQRAMDLGCTTMQIFTKNNKSWFAKEIEEEEAALFRSLMKRSSLSKILAHAAYLINVGSGNKEVAKTSTTSLAKELDRCNILGIPYLVVHPGSHVGIGEGKCIQQISSNLDIALEKSPGRPMVLLENTAGQGTNVGHKFEHLRSIYDLCHNKKRIGMCFDTCHAFAAGYDLGTEAGYKKVWGEFEKIVGTHLLKAIHLNDSKTPIGSHKDRHENIGQGTIPLLTFSLLMNDKLFENIPKIIETPADKAGSIYKKEIELLRNMIK